MESLTVSLDTRSFQLFLNGLNQVLFGSENNNSAEQYAALTAKLYKSCELDDSNEIQNEVNLFESILRKGAQDAWSSESLGDFLRARSFPEEHTTVFCAFWTKESAKVSSVLFNC
jgi:hypothetical protein